MKKAVLIVVPILLIGGGLVGAAMMGMIDIPGLSPAKKNSKAAAVYSEAKDEKPIAKEDDPKPPAKAVEEKPPELDMDMGRKKLAKVWNELDATQILEIAKDWKDEDLARQLRFMDTAKTAEVLSSMKPLQASKISKLLQQLQSPPLPPAS